MNELYRLIFDDLILCFFSKNYDLLDPQWRDYWLDGKEWRSGYREAFPENEVCEEIREVLITRSCGCCSDYKYHPANYIKEIN